MLDVSALPEGSKDSYIAFDLEVGRRKELTSIVRERWEPQWRGGWSLTRKEQMLPHTSLILPRAFLHFSHRMEKTGRNFPLNISF